MEHGATGAGAVGRAREGLAVRENFMVKAHRKICEVLAEARVDFVFGIPGGSAMRIFDSLSHYADRVRPILVRHEQAASVMADIYGRLTGKPGVVLGQGRSSAPTLFSEPWRPTWRARPWWCSRIPPRAAISR